MNGGMIAKHEIITPVDDGNPYYDDDLVVRMPCIFLYIRMVYYIDTLRSSYRSGKTPEVLYIEIR